jgi:hypothetical protein
MGPASGPDLTWIRNPLEASGAKSIVMMRRLLREESSRPAQGQYVFAHVLIPHLPYFIDRNLERQMVKTSHYEQSLASVKLMTMVIDRLKELGRYESATIVFQGDHGRSYGNDAPVEMIKSPHALLLIKRPGDSGALKISDYPAQLLDVAPTLYGLAGIDVHFENGGVDLFSPAPETARDVHILNYKNHNMQERDGFQHVILRRGEEWVESSNLEESGAGALPRTSVTLNALDTARAASLDRTIETADERR